MLLQAVATLEYLLEESVQLMFIAPLAACLLSKGRKDLSHSCHILQAMARSWREGQKNHVFIYRLLTAGALLHHNALNRNPTRQALATISAS